MVDDGRCLAPRQKPNFTPQSQQLHYKRLSICSFKDFSRRHRDLHIIQRPSFRRSFPDRRSSLDTSVERTTNRLNQMVLYFDWLTAENYVMDWSYMEKFWISLGLFFLPGKKDDTGLATRILRMFWTVSFSIYHNRYVRPSNFKKISFLLKFLFLDI